MGGFILVISGPSGSGKSTLLSRILEDMPDIYFSISSTSRKMREGEKDGVDYHFVSEDEFEKDIADDYFLEWANVHGNYYGTSFRYIDEALSKGKIVVLDIDVQGHKIIRDKLGDKITSVFITTNKAHVLEERLLARATDTKEVIQKRITNAKEEIKRIDEYDFLIVNEDITKATDELKSIIKATANKVAVLDADSFSKEWSGF